VEVGDGGAHRHVESHQPPQANAGGRHVRGPHGGVGDHDDVTLQAAAFSGQEPLEVGAAHLLLSLDQELEVDGQRSVRLQQAAGRLDLKEELSLVVDGPTGPALTVGQGGLEGRPSPLVQRVHGLHVVMAVHQGSGGRGTGV
jgi:hypothetical protein